MIIGTNFLVKVNANIGNSALSSSIEEEMNEMVKHGADILWIYRQAIELQKQEDTSVETLVSRHCTSI